jgi:hypothetical protein
VIVRNDPLDLTSKPAVVGRIVTATVALVCVLIVYDGWAALKLFDVVVVIVGPVVAFLHDARLLGQSRPAGSTRTTANDARVARHGALRVEVLLPAVPPLAVLLVLQLAKPHRTHNPRTSRSHNP